MRILALDMARKTGVAVGDSSGAPTCRTFDLGESGAPHGSCFSQAEGMMRLLIREHSPDVIAIEKAIISGAPGAQERLQLALGWRSVAFLVAYRKKIAIREYAVQTARKHFIGHGSLPSREAKTAVFQRCKQLRWPANNTDEADACAIWELARSKLARKFTMPRGLFDEEGDSGSGKH